MISLPTVTPLPYTYRFGSFCPGPELIIGVVRLVRGSWAQAGLGVGFRGAY